MGPNSLRGIFFPPLLLNQIETGRSPRRSTRVLPRGPAQPLREADLVGGNASDPAIR